MFCLILSPENCHEVFLQLMSPLLWMLQASKSSIYAIVTFLLTVESSTGLGAEATL